MGMRNITAKLPERYFDLIQELIKRGHFSSKSEVIREALRLLFSKYGLIEIPFYDVKEGEDEPIDDYEEEFEEG